MSDNPIVRAIEGQQPADWEGKLDLLKRTVAAGATNDELDLFLYQARRTGLDPLARQIYYVKRKGKGTIQVGIDGLRLIADRTGQYAGSDDAEFIGATPEGWPEKARVTVYKMVQGQRCPFTATARWSEFYPGPDQGFQWRKMPHTMLAKCAEAQALRKAFPADLSGIYTNEEMMQAAQPDEPKEAKYPAPESDMAINADFRVVEESTGEVKETAPTTKPDPHRPTHNPGLPSGPQAAPDGKTAFGYVAVRWPLAKMFAEPMTDAQHKMIGAKAAERAIEPELLPHIRRAVLEAYGLKDEGSKANASLLIDFLINAEEETIERVITAAEEMSEAAQSPLQLEA